MSSAVFIVIQTGLFSLSYVQKATKGSANRLQSRAKEKKVRNNTHSTISLYLPFSLLV
jgi:hypothetical protein